ncbi:related to MRPL51 - mitochondrial ribosomal protein, large subunit [Moesziomyces antarcticus]|uniref:Large ribosomal subunit protein mL43 n=1 Tax=Pseudozyma antarctica TaxID=84753 RepID=A0A5C3FR25_PSEA2|nr:related to MRPL51 - mitochondrial ribosomal protein, large subunit [Moesziomyces antarcticus]
MRPITTTASRIMSYLKSFSRILRGSLSTNPGGVSGTPGSFHLPLRKLVLRYSQHNPSSAGTRAFLLSSTFTQLSKKYPSVEFVVTEAGNAKHPLVTGFYADTSAAAFRSEKRKDISLANLDVGQVGAKVQRVVEASGDKTKSLKRRTTLSRNESARGVWSQLHDRKVDI